MALGHGSGFIKSWLAPRLSPASLCPPQPGYCCWRQGSSLQGAGLVARGRWGPSESGRQTVRWAERGAETQSRTERPPWKTPPPGDAALGTRPHPCCHSSGAKIPVGPPLHRCLSVLPASGHAHRSRGGSTLGAGDGAGPGSGAGVVGRRPAYGAAAGCILDPDPHLPHHCLATSSSAVREPNGGRKEAAITVLSLQTPPYPPHLRPISQPHQEAGAPGEGQRSNDSTVLLLLPLESHSDSC